MTKYLRLFVLLGFVFPGIVLAVPYRLHAGSANKLKLIPQHINNSVVHAVGEFNCQRYDNRGANKGEVSVGIRGDEVWLRIDCSSAFFKADIFDEGRLVSFNRLVRADGSQEKAQRHLGVESYYRLSGPPPQYRDSEYRAVYSELRFVRLDLSGDYFGLRCHPRREIQCGYDPQTRKFFVYEGRVRPHELSLSSKVKSYFESIDLTDEFRRFLVAFETMKPTPQSLPIDLVLPSLREAILERIQGSERAADVQEYVRYLAQIRIPTDDYQDAIDNRLSELVNEGVVSQIKLSYAQAKQIDSPESYQRFLNESEEKKWRDFEEGKFYSSEAKKRKDVVMNAYPGVSEAVRRQIFKHKREVERLGSFTHHILFKREDQSLKIVGCELRNVTGGKTIPLDRWAAYLIEPGIGDLSRKLLMKFYPPDQLIETGEFDRVEETFYVQKEADFEPLTKALHALVRLCGERADFSPGDYPFDPIVGLNPTESQP